MFVFLSFCSITGASCGIQSHLLPFYPQAARDRTLQVWHGHLQWRKCLWPSTWSLHRTIQWRLHILFSNFHPLSWKTHYRYQGQWKHCSSYGRGHNKWDSAEWQHNSDGETVARWSGVGRGRRQLRHRCLWSKPHLLFWRTPVHSLSSHDGTFED